MDSLFVCLFIDLDGIWHLEWCLISIVNLPGLGITLEICSWGYLGGFSRPSLRKEGPPWFWLAPSHGLGLRSECKEWKKCQNSPCPDSQFSQMWGVPAACSRPPRTPHACPVRVDCTLTASQKKFSFPQRPFSHSHEKYKQHTWQKEISLLTHPQTELNLEFILAFQSSKGAAPRIWTLWCRQERIGR